VHEVFTELFPASRIKKGVVWQIQHKVKDYLKQKVGFLFKKAEKKLLKTDSENAKAACMINHLKN